MDFNPAQARIVDPVLTNHATGYSQPGLIADQLFPYVTVPSRSAKRIVFGKEALRLYSSLRAPGAVIKQVGFGYEAETVAVNQHALAALVPIEHVEEADRGPGIDLQMRAVGLVARSIELEREVECANLARNAANYDANHKLALAAGARWTQAGSTPQKDVEDAKQAIRKTTGFVPNVLELSATTRAALIVHPDVVAYRKAIGQPGVNDQMLAAYFDVEKIVVGQAIVSPDGDGLNDVWGDDAILAYVDTSQGRAMEMPSYGYTYRLRGYPMVNPTRWEADRRSWVNDYVNEYRPYIVGNDAGFLIQNAGQA